jgi:capsular polysaccharide biosynthesis protein
LELRYYLAVLRRRVAFILLTAFLAAGVAALLTPKAPRYSATSVLYVGATKFAVGPNATYSFDPTQLAERLLKTYSTMIDSEPVAADAISTTSVPRTAKKVVKESTVEQVTGTQLLRITVVDRSPEVAAQLTNGLSDAFVRKVGDLEGRPGQGSVPSLPAYVFQRADVPDSALSTGLGRNVALAAFFGLLLAVGVAFLLDRLDLTLRSRSEVEDRLGLPVLGSIPYSQEAAAGVRIPIGEVRPAAARLRAKPTIGA